MLSFLTSPPAQQPQGFATSAAVAMVFFVLGVMIPRPKWLSATNATTSSSSARATALLAMASSPAGLVLRRLALAFHGFALVRELWYALTVRGTFGRVRRATWDFVKHPSRGFALPRAVSLTTSSSSSCLSPDKAGPAAAGGAIERDDSWHVTEDDLHSFRAAVESPESLGTWGEPMLVKDFGTMTYAAWRRFLPDGKTEYKSITVAMDSTAEEFSDFFLDDDARGGVKGGENSSSGWDPMICDHESLEVDSSSSSAVAGRRQVVRWRRSFPFAFLSDREYCIARRSWRCPADGSIYTATKTIPSHPKMDELRASRDLSGKEKVVSMDVFYSTWRSRTIPCPSGRPGAPPACETLLLHREDFKIPENLARFAVKAGMAGFVKKMAPAVRTFVEGRRSRGVAPDGHDADAYGVREAWGKVVAAKAGGKASPLPAPPPPPEAATFGALGDITALPLTTPAVPPSKAAAAAALLRPSVSFAQLPPPSRRGSSASEVDLGIASSPPPAREGFRQVPSSFALSSAGSEATSPAPAAEAGGDVGPPPAPRLRRSFASAPQLSSLGSRLANAAADLAEMLPARVKAVGAALGSPLLGSPPETPSKKVGGEEEGEAERASASASTSPEAATAAVWRASSPSPPPSHHHHHHRPGHHHAHHHYVGGRGRRRGGSAAAGGRARSPPPPSASASAGDVDRHRHSHPHSHSRPPLAADLLRAGVAVAVAVAVASRAGKAAGRAEARAEFDKLREQESSRRRTGRRWGSDGGSSDGDGDDGGGRRLRRRPAARA